MGYIRLSTFIWILMQGGLVGSRYCFSCSGQQCMEDPTQWSLVKYGRVKCHPVDEYCTTHVRYQLVDFTDVTFPPVPFDRYAITLGPKDYFAQSVTRKCTKTNLGNTCRRDWLGKPEITCITTCQEDFCNCDIRSPPQQMFRAGKPLPLAPKDAVYFDHDLRSCRVGEVVPEPTNQSFKRRRKIKKYVPSSSNRNSQERLHIFTLYAIISWYIISLS